MLGHDGTSGQVLRWYAYGAGSNDVLNQMDVVAGTRQTCIPDLQGSILATLDSSTATLTKRGYLPYGTSASVTGSFAYAGQRIDAETNGLYYARARLYAPVLGRFLQPDPIGYVGGKNLYAYVGNDPLNGIDPAGLAADMAQNAGRGSSFCLICPAQAQTTDTSLGQIVVLPNEARVPDPKSPTGYLMSPVADLSPVAAAGRQTGVLYQQLLAHPETAAGASLYLAASFMVNVGTGGAFDYQRSGNQILGLLTRGATFTQLPQFRNVSNFNVGVFVQQAGLSLPETLSIAGQYASVASRSYRPGQPYNLDPQTAAFIQSGFGVAQSGVFGQPPR